VNDSQRALQLFDEAVLLDPPLRAQWLDSACGVDTPVRREVEQLLEADRRANDFLATPLSDSSDRSGEVLGVWKLDRLIGSGGMGSVYRARRSDGAYDKFVAIKFLLFDAGDLRRRFALEQRILGALTHPNIAALLDVGRDAHGAPYLVMEYVDGVPITAYAEDHMLDLRARIALFANILDAMQTAHSQLIVHRDIKPSNVLVDARGAPKLLDFGIAKLIDQPSAAQTRTALGPLTPEYASPEQVRGDLVGTPTDIYSLGVLLYELVTGDRPYRIVDSSPTGVERTVCETDPPRPSTRLSANVGGSMRDMDAIILKALEKTPARRYRSCAEFASDLQHWLDGAQVMAREPTQREKIARYLRRHRLAVSVAAAMTFTLLIGFGATLWEAMIAREQARTARVERDRAQSAIHFLTATLSAANPENLGRNVTVLEVLQHARTDSQRELSAHPDVAATVQEALADTFLAVGDMQAARESAEKAVETARTLQDEGLIIDSELSLGYVLRQNGDLQRAQSLFDSARTHAVAHGSAAQRSMSAEMLGALALTRQDNAKSQTWYRTGLAEVDRSDLGARAELLNGLAIAKNNAGDTHGAVELHMQALKVLRDAHETDDPRMAKTLINLANAEDDIGDSASAEKFFVEGLAMQIALDGDWHPDVVNTLGSVTLFYVDQNNATKALDYGARAVEGSKHLPANNLQVPYAQYSQARALLLAARPADAVPLLQSALAARVTIYSADHPLALITQAWLGLARAQTGERDVGREMAKAAYSHLRDSLGDDHRMTKRARTVLDTIDALPAK
jgi:eukaryotic-like serine/threonine-protein kinase